MPAIPGGAWAGWRTGTHGGNSPWSSGSGCGDGWVGRLPAVTASFRPQSLNLLPRSLLSTVPSVVGLVLVFTSFTRLLGAVGGVGEVADPVELPPSIPDPLEPLNRVVWEFNKGLMIAVIQPTSRVYRYVVVAPVRHSISDFGRNLTFPGRLINEALQGRWTDTREESYRFLCNTTAGVGGLWDVATRWGIPKPDADFGQTFGRWGWSPDCFLMLPVFGPSSDRDALGLAADTAANPLLYISPYKPQAGRPFSYLGPYSYFSYLVSYNRLADSVNESVRFSRAEPDPYSEIQRAWTFLRSNRVVDLSVEGARDEASLETIDSIYFTHQDPEFPVRARNRSVSIPTTGRRLIYTYWLQRGAAPVVYITPGLGAHRLSPASLALAELVFKHGYTAVCVSSVFSSEFMEKASAAGLPGFLPVDGHELRVALTEVDRRLRADHPGRLGQAALVGCSMGGFHSLFLAANEEGDGRSLIRFDRYVAISAPVRLLHGAESLDECYRAPLNWPASERAAKLENLFLKVAALEHLPPAAESPLPFDATESRFLIGAAFRLVLRDIVFTSQQRHDQGLLQHSLFSLRRDPVYREILRFSYRDYFERLLIPYLQRHGMPETSRESVALATDLRTYSTGLRGNPKVRVISNQNDFLLSAEDLDWLRATVSPARFRLFPHGGHMGNLSTAEVQTAILESLEGLGTPGAASR